MRIAGSAKKALAEVWNAEDKPHSLAAALAFDAAYGAKFPRATAKITDDLDQLLAFYRSKVTKGPGSRAADLAMAFKPIESAQDRWRAVNAPHLVALVRGGSIFINGKLIEPPGENTAPEAAQKILIQRY